MSCNHIVQNCLLKDQNHYLLRLLHGRTLSTITHSIFLLELHPLGLFRSSLLVMAVEQATSLSPEIVVFMIIGKGSSSNGRQVFFKKICFFIFTDWLFHLVQEWKTKWQNLRLRIQRKKQICEFMLKEQ